MRWIALTLLTLAGASAQSNPWDLGQPDAKVMIGVNLKALRESALGQVFRSQMSSQKPQPGPAAMALGFLDQIDRVFISSTAAASPRATTTARTSAVQGNPPFLAVVEGRLPVQQLLGFLPGTPRPYRSVNVYRGAKLTDPSIASFDEHTLVIGDDKSVLAAIDRRAGVAPAASASAARVQQLASQYDFWMLATDDLSKFQPNGGKFPSQLAGEIKGIDLGLAARDGVQMEMSMTMANEAAATQLLQLISGQIALAQAQTPEMTEVASKLRISTDGAHLRASMALSQEEFERSLRTLQAARAAAGASAAQPAAPYVPQTRQPPPPPPGKVRIYGLEGGVREIDVTR